MFGTPIITSIVKLYCNTSIKIQRFQWSRISNSLTCLSVYITSREAKTYTMPLNFPNGAINSTLRYVVNFQSFLSSVRKGGLEPPVSDGLSTYCSRDWESNYCMCTKINGLHMIEDFRNLNSSINGTYNNV